MARPQGAFSKRTLRILEAVRPLLDPHQPTTVRYVLYSLISQGVLEGTGQYQRLIQVLIEARIRGEINDDCFVDKQRRLILPQTWNDLSDYSQCVIDSYSRDPWKDQEVRVELWVEKNTVAGVLESITRRWNIPLRPSTGFFSRPQLCEAAGQIVQSGKETYIYYIGDFDPSGMNIEHLAREGNDKTGTQKREGLYQIMPTYSDSRNEIPQVHWKRLAVRPEKFAGLPDYAKVPVKELDRRTPAFVTKYGEFGAEVEAVPQDELRQMVESAIKSHIDQARWKKSKRREHTDEKKLSKLFSMEI